MSRIVRLPLRLLALAALAALLVGVPVVVVQVLGLPLPSVAQLRTAWTSRRIDDDLVVRVGAGVFTLLWTWFALTALAELWHVVAWRFGGASVRLAPVPPGPAGWIRGLVRFALLSSVSVGATLSSVASVTGPVLAAAPDAAPTVVAASVLEASHVDPAGVHTANGRDTPYSIATTRGRPELRDRIVELNHGRAAPDGAVWLGGVFPEGMEVLLPDELGQAHHVVAGDCYWDIADRHLTATLHRDPTAAEVLDLTNELVALNAPRLGHRDPTLLRPGETVLLTAGAPAPAPAAPTVPTAPAVPAPLPVEHGAPSPALTPQATPPAAATSRDAGGVSPIAAYAAGLGTALMVAAGAVGALESSRRRRWRAAVVGERVEAPQPAHARTELLLRSVAPGERLARLDLALRAAADDLAGQGATVTAALVSDAGDVRLFLRGAPTPSSPLWQLDVLAGTWTLPASVDLTTLAAVARERSHPCPAMVHLGGARDGGECFVDLEAVGVLAVESPHAAPILRCLAASLAVSPFVDASKVFTVGTGDPLPSGGGSTRCEVVDSLDAALDAAASAIGSTAAIAAGHTFTLRVAAAGGEAWEPAVVIAAGRHDPALLATLATGVHPGDGLGVAVEGVVPGAPWSLRWRDGGHVLEPLGMHVHPSGLDDAAVAEVAGLLAAAQAPAEPYAPVVPITSARAVVEPFVEPAWSLMIRTLGPVEVVSRDGTTAVFERSKAAELVAWLGCHRDRPTRTGARTALWDLDVRDATFANVVSDARRGLARAIAPPEGEEWIARTLTEELPLHAGVVTDAILLAARVEHARGLPPVDALEVLRPGVELLAGMPFAGTGYLWTDAEGITSSLVLLAVGAASELATHCLALGDVDGVFWATGQGLKVLAGHEELIALRMRAHSRRGDLAGVRHEWESYERALAADPWAAAEPAPKLLALRRELLGGPARASGANH